MLVAFPIVLLSISVAYKILTLVYPIEIETLDMEAVNAKAQTGPMTMKEIKFIVLFVTMVLLCSTEKIHGFSTPICASIFSPDRGLLRAYQYFAATGCSAIDYFPYRLLQNVRNV